MKGIKHIGGEKVTRGTYWNFSNGNRVTMDRDGILPGDRNATYVKAHPILVLLAAPLLGLVYAVFLPFIGIASIVTMVARKLLGGMAHEISKAATFGWRPVEAYLSGKRKKEDTGARKEEPREERSQESERDAA